MTDALSLAAEISELAALPAILFTTWIMGASGMLTVPYKLAVYNTKRALRKLKERIP